MASRRPLSSIGRRPHPPTHLPSHELKKNTMKKREMISINHDEMKESKEILSRISETTSLKKKQLSTSIISANIDFPASTRSKIQKIIQNDHHNHWAQRGTKECQVLNHSTQQHTRNPQKFISSPPQKKTRMLHSNEWNWASDHRNISLARQRFIHSSIHSFDCCETEPPLVRSNN